MNSENTWLIRVPKRVAKTISRFPSQDQERIKDILHEFEIYPWRGDITKIKGEQNKWRRRTGNYRIFYAVYPEKRIVDITEIERRTSKTY